MSIISTTTADKLFMHLVLNGLEPWQIASSKWLINLSLVFSIKRAKSKRILINLLNTFCVQSKIKQMKLKFQLHTWLSRIMSQEY